MKMNPAIDIVIPIYKPDGRLEKNITRLLKQTVMPRHIYLLETVTGESLYDVSRIDGAGDRVSVHPVKKEDFDHGGTRNYGASLSQSEYILFMTQDAVPIKTTLVESLLAPHQKDEHVAVSYGRQLAGKSSGAIEKLTRVFNYPEQSLAKDASMLETMGIKAFFCSDVCAMYRRKFFEEMGGFVEPAIFNEDMIMARKFLDAGYVVFYAADAQVIHSHRYTYMQQFRRNFDLAVSQRQYPEIFADISSESEGIRMVKQNTRVLCKRGKWYLVPHYIVESGFKFLGYRMGKAYRLLPKRVVRFCTMNKMYWDKEIH